MVLELLWSNWLDLIQMAGMVLLFLADVHHLQIAVLGRKRDHRAWKGGHGVR
jgi:hypothetical protein